MKPTFRRPTLKRVRTATRVAPTLSRTAPLAVRTTLPARIEPVRRAAAAPLSAEWPNLLPDPYVDYMRILTHEGGIKFFYKGYDASLRHKLLALFLWSSTTSLEGWILLHHATWVGPPFNLFCLAVVALINLFIVTKPVEAFFSIEIRPDCMILDDRDIFWLQQMEVTWPQFQQDEGGNQALCGIYGNRFVKFLTVLRFDEFDRTPEVLAANLQEAMQQLWTKPQPF
jgi:hypothetical protein